MKLIVKPSTLQGAVNIPGSKSHTIRAVAIAALASGESLIEQPLESADGRAAFDAYQALGAEITAEQGAWRVQGLGGLVRAPENVIDVGNSGTTMRIAMGSAALLKEGAAVLTGDEQIRRRPNGPLAQALNDLGAKVHSTRRNGNPPFVVEGPLWGGACTFEALTSQYVTALLINTPLAERDTIIHVPVLHEKPYVHITLDWIRRHGITVEHDEELSEFHILAGQAYTPVHRRIPGDFSSATFFLAAGALAGNSVTSLGLDMNDTQGDKAVVDYLRALGATIDISDNGVAVSAKNLQGQEIDLNATPDALPMMAALACFSQGETRLVNAPQARVKETDRIAVMCQELTKLGADIEELPDGLIIRESQLHAAAVEGHDDHRIVMSLAIAASQINGETTINGYEAVNVTYPTFLEAFQGLGGEARVEGENHA